jgi:uncharacterized protein (TIGR02569 family)
MCTQDGKFVHDGWQSWEYLEGKHIRGRWHEKIETCLQFHKAIAGFQRPTYLDNRDQNPWVIADKVSWGEIEIEHHPLISPSVERLRNCLQDVSQQPQLIHGDFCGNILFSDYYPPAIIDFSPYWRPVEFAIGVIVADAIVWEGADESLIDEGDNFENFLQHLARADLRRIIEIETIYWMYGWQMLEQIGAHLPLINAICQRIG